MPSDSSNARVGSRDPSQGEESQGTSASGDLPSGTTPHAAILSDAPGPSVDPEDEGGALLSELTVGAVVDGKYRVDQVLGRGAMGVVVAATHQQLGERVALKFLRYRAKAGVNDDFQTRFRREARLSAKLKNEHITRVIDVGVWRDRVPYMVMDYLAGTDLREVMKATGPMPIGTAIEYTVQVCEGIAEAHANGVVHRDLKPSNLFVTKRPDGSDLIKILDFGISKWSVGEAAVDELTQTGVVLGSPKYMAPEQLFGSSEVDARADVWSLGAILYEMLSGRPPFDLPSFTRICAELSTDRMPPSLVARRADIPPELEAVVMKCFQRTTDLRVANVAELAGGVLAAVQAPFADAVRTKIAFTLDPKTSRDPMGTSGGAMGMSTGSYSSILTQSGAGRALPMPAFGAESTGASPTSISGAMAKPERRRWALWLVPLAALVAGGAIFVALSGKNSGSTTPAQSTATPVTTAALPPALEQPPATATALTTATPTTATITTAASTAATIATASTPATSTSPAPSLPPRRVVHGGGRPPHTTGGLPPATGAPPPATTTTTQPVATTPPATTTKTDPLGDRQ